MAKAKGNRFQKLVTRGIVQEKKERMDELEVQIDNLSKDINYALFITDGVESIDMESARVSMKELDAKVAEFLKLKKEMEELS